MVTVQRYNVILEIDEHSLDKYISLGYSQIDPKSGEIIKEAIPNDVQVLRLAFAQHKNTIKELESQVEKLKKQVASLKKKAKAEKEADE